MIFGYVLADLPELPVDREPELRTLLHHKHGANRPRNIRRALCAHQIASSHERGIATALATDESQSQAGLRCWQCGEGIANISIFD